MVVPLLLLYYNKGDGEKELHPIFSLLFIIFLSLPEQGRPAEYKLRKKKKGHVLGCCRGGGSFGNL